jgi:DNA transposition AAA+ family ATPase
VLKGDYVGSWKNIIDAIRGYKKTADLRGMIQQAEFAENGITKMIFNSLDYALANNSISLIIGESGQGKTFAVENWKAQNPHKAVMVTAPAYGGAKMLLADICMEVGAGRKLNIYDAKSALKKAFNKNRILIVDEAHRLLPGERQTQPRGLEFLRDLRDQSKCGLAVVATTRFDVEIRKSDYLYEQFLGRSLTTRLPKKIREADIEPIVRQYVGRATAEAMGVCLSVANNTYRHEAEKDSKGRVIRYADLDRGRIRILVEILKLASRQAKKAGEKCSSEFIFKAVATRMQFQGEL